MNQKVTFCKNDRIYYYLKSFNKKSPSTISSHFCELTIARTDTINSETGMSSSLPQFENVISLIKAKLLSEPITLESLEIDSSSSLVHFKELALLQTIQDISNQNQLDLDRIDFINSVNNYSIHYYPKQPDNTLIKITLPLCLNFNLKSDFIPDLLIESIRLTFDLNSLKANKLIFKKTSNNQTYPIQIDQSKLKDLDYLYHLRDEVIESPQPITTEFILADQSIVKLLS